MRGQGAFRYLASAMTGPYRNESGADVNGWKALRWGVERAIRRLPRPPAAPIVGIDPDLAFLRQNRDVPSFTWIGHATALVQVGGVNVLTDPVFSRVASPVAFAGPRRHQPPGIALPHLPRVDVVVLSHTHYDHLDLRSMRALARQAGGPPLFLVPAGVERWFARNVPGVVTHGAEARVLGVPWDGVVRDHPAAPGLEFHFLRVQHWTSRSPFRRNDTPWGSWAVLHPSWRFWFSGDLGYSRDPQRIGERLGGVDLAAIAIGAYEPRWMMRTQHVNPEEAVQVMLDVGAREAIGIHWGTFALTDESLDQPPRDLAVAVQARGLPAGRFGVLRHGETRRFAGRVP